MPDQYSKKVCDVPVDQDQALDGADIDQKQSNMCPDGNRKAPTPAEPESHKQQTRYKSVSMSDLVKDTHGDIARPLSLKDDPDNQNFEAHDDLNTLGVVDSAESAEQLAMEAWERARRRANGEDFYMQMTITDLPDRDTQSTEARATTQTDTLWHFRSSRPPIVASSQSRPKTQRHREKESRNKKISEELDRDLEDYFKNGPTEL